MRDNVTMPYMYKVHAQSLLPMLSPVITISCLYLQGLRDRSMQFILRYFNEVSRTPAFEEMGRTNVDLSKSPCVLYTLS